MSKLVNKGRTPPITIWLKAWVNWLRVAPILCLGVLLTYFPFGILVALTSKKQMSHPLNKPLESQHSEKYTSQGSSGSWEYWNSSLLFLMWFNNYEDGTLGEPSGKNSARVGGNERSFWSQYKWLCRNSFNWKKRTSNFFFCPVDDCDIEYWGSYDLSDKTPTTSGSQLVKATSRVDGKVYYGYRYVKDLGNSEVRQYQLGFKIKPSHALETQDVDDKDKAFTARLQFKSEAD